MGRCTVCRGTGHNKRNCPVKDAPPATPNKTTTRSRAKVVEVIDISQEGENEKEVLIPDKRVDDSSERNITSQSDAGRTNELGKDSGLEEKNVGTILGEHQERKDFFNGVDVNVKEQLHSKDVHQENSIPGAIMLDEDIRLSDAEKKSNFDVLETKVSPAPNQWVESASSTLPEKPSNSSDVQMRDLNEISVPISEENDGTQMKIDSETGTDTVNAEGEREHLQNASQEIIQHRVEENNEGLADDGVAKTDDSDLKDAVVNVEHEATASLNPEIALDSNTGGGTGHERIPAEVEREEIQDAKVIAVEDEDKTTSEQPEESIQPPNTTQLHQESPLDSEKFNIDSSVDIIKNESDPIKPSSPTTASIPEFEEKANEGTSVITTIPDDENESLNTPSKSEPVNSETKSEHQGVQIGSVQIESNRTEPPPTDPIQSHPTPHTFNPIESHLSSYDDEDERPPGTETEPQERLIKGSVPDTNGAVGQTLELESELFEIPSHWYFYPTCRLCGITEDLSVEEVKSEVENYAKIHRIIQEPEKKDSILIQLDNSEDRKEDLVSKLKTSLKDAKIKDRTVTIESVDVDWLLFIGNLSESIDDDKLEQIFENFGKIEKAFVMYNSKNVAKGYGFVLFSRKAEAERAKMGMDNFDLTNKLIKVEWCTIKDVSELFSSVLYVENVPLKIPNVAKILDATFESYGKVRGCEVISTPSGTHAYVDFFNSLDAEKAKQALDNNKFYGSLIKVIFANPNKCKKLSKPVIQMLKPPFPAQGYAQDWRKSAYSGAYRGTPRPPYARAPTSPLPPGTSPYTRPYASPPYARPSYRPSFSPPRAPASVRYPSPPLPSSRPQYGVQSFPSPPQATRPLQIANVPTPAQTYSSPTLKTPALPRPVLTPQVPSPTISSQTFNQHSQYGSQTYSQYATQTTSLYSSTLQPTQYYSQTQQVLTQTPIPTQQASSASYSQVQSNAYQNYVQTPQQSYPQYAQQQSYSQPVHQQQQQHQQQSQYQDYQTQQQQQSQQPQHVAPQTYSQQNYSQQYADYYAQAQQSQQTQQPAIATPTQQQTAANVNQQANTYSAYYSQAQYDANYGISDTSSATVSTSAQTSATTQNYEAEWAAYYAAQSTQQPQTDVNAIQSQPTPSQHTYSAEAVTYYQQPQSESGIKRSLESTEYASSAATSTLEAYATPHDAKKARY